jgi:hypothetical protein
VGDHYRLLLQAVVYHNYKESVLNHALLLAFMKKSPTLAKLSPVSVITIMILLLVAAPAVLSFSSLMMIPSAAGTSPSSGIELSPQPIYQREPSTSGVTPINQTHIASTFSANGTLTLPNTTETINTTSNGSSITSLATQSAIGKETIMTEDGETVIATFYEILEFPPGAGGANGITIAVLHTNSTTDRLAPLNGTIVVGTDYLYPISEGFGTFWEWVPTPPPSLLPTTGMEESPPPSPMNATATATDATTAAEQEEEELLLNGPGGI